MPLTGDDLVYPRRTRCVKVNAALFARNQKRCQSEIGSARIPP